MIDFIRRVIDKMNTYIDGLGQSCDISSFSSFSSGY